MTDHELEMEIRSWHRRVQVASPSARRASPVWVAIREVAEAFGNWKNAARGDPRKGYVAMKGGKL